MEIRGQTELTQITRLLPIPFWEITAQNSTFTVQGASRSASFVIMARLPRVVVVDIPHHVTQRGNARQVIFSSDFDRLTYLDLLQHHCGLYHLALLGYCLMSNHVHLIAVPRAADSLAQALQHTHGRYAAYWNARQSSSGHVWQGRFYSCPLDEPHLWSALRYVESNPVRAGMVETAWQWKWSSAAAHCAVAGPEPWSDLQLWQKRWTMEAWTEFLAAGESAAEITALRQFTHPGRPLRTAHFIAELEQSLSRPLTPRKRGRHPRPIAESDERQIAFVA